MKVSKTLKKLLAAGAIAVLAAGIFTGCGSTSSTQDEKKIVVGTNATFVPFEFKNEKTTDYDGFDIELIREVGKRLNKDVELKNVSFDALIPALNSHDIDVAVSGMTITKARSENVLFSSPYYENALAVVFKDGTSITSLDDLKGKTVAVQLGTTGADLADKLEGTTVKKFDHSNEARGRRKSSRSCSAAVRAMSTLFRSTRWRRVRSRPRSPKPCAAFSRHSKSAA